MTEEPGGIVPILNVLFPVFIAGMNEEGNILVWLSLTFVGFSNPFIVAITPLA